MFDRDRFILAYGVDHLKWSKRYGIEIASAPCYRCGTELFTTVPFVVRGTKLRGLIAPRCQCGHVNPPYSLVHETLRMDEYLRNPV